MSGAGKSVALDQLEDAGDEGVDNLPLDSTASILTAGLLGEKYIGISVGGDDELLKDGDTIQDTQSSLVLEDLIGKFLLNSVNKE
jgi:phospholipid/cholesterol/gamma-HCH transport system substrate-binding protein